MNIQETIRTYYEAWEAAGQWVQPDLKDALMFMVTEIGEAMDAALRQQEYVRNNAKETASCEYDIAIEIFDAIMMGCIALDVLGDYDLEKVATIKLAIMDDKRGRINERTRLANRETDRRLDSRAA